MLTRFEIAIISGTFAGGAVWQLVRDLLAISSAPGDPVWAAACGALLLGSLAVYFSMMVLIVNDTNTKTHHMERNAAVSTSVAICGTSAGLTSRHTAMSNTRTNKSVSSINQLNTPKGLLRQLSFRSLGV